MHRCFNTGLRPGFHQLPHRERLVQLLHAGALHQQPLRQHDALLRGLGGQSTEMSRCMSPDSMYQQPPRPRYLSKGHLPIAIQPTDCDCRPPSLNSRVFKHGQLKHCTTFRMCSQRKSLADLECLHEWPPGRLTLGYISETAFPKKRAVQGMSCVVYNLAEI